MNRLSIGAALGLASLPGAVDAGASQVSITQDEAGKWVLLKNGAPYTIRGAGGLDHLEVLRNSGGNTLRTWGVEQLQPDQSGESLLDRCAQLGLSVVVGLWVTHPRHGGEYDDETFLDEQRKRIRASVRQYRDHPAVLMWGLGNEMEGDGTDIRVWRELEVLANIIKEEDEAHPICTVLAGTYNNKVAAMMEHYTALDILGINIYGGAELVDGSLAQQGWDRPYLLTEFGPVGHWEVPVTDWGAPIEPTSADKAETYAFAHQSQFSSGRDLCLGTFSFIWGHKQETTSTWFGMFLATGEKTPVVDAMNRIWTGEEPANRSPVIRALHADFSEKSIGAGTEHEVWAELADADGDELTFEWQVVAETTDRKFGGDAEEAPPTIPDCVVENRGTHARIRLPETPGPYRVFLYVRDGHGGGAAGNFPFLVE